MTILRSKAGPCGPRLVFHAAGFLCRHESAQRRHHRPCRPWQDHPGRSAAATVGRLPRESAGGRARARFQRSRARARHHHSLQGDIDPLAGHAHQYRRHSRPRRFRRRGGTHPQYGGRRARPGRCGRRAAAADQVRGLQGAQGRAQADRHHQQGRSAGCAADGGGERSLRPFRRPLTARPSKDGCRPPRTLRKDTRRDKAWPRCSIS